MGALIDMAKEQVYEMLADAWWSKKACEEHRFDLFQLHNHKKAHGASEVELFDIEELMDATDVEQAELNLNFECNREFASRYGVTLEDALSHTKQLTRKALSDIVAKYD